MTIAAMSMQSIGKYLQNLIGSNQLNGSITSLLRLIIFNNIAVIHLLALLVNFLLPFLLRVYLANKMIVREFVRFLRSLISN